MKLYHLILLLIVVALLDVHLVFIIKPYFEEAPSTKVWFCLTWMAMATEMGIGAIWYYATKTKP